MWGGRLPLKAGGAGSAAVTVGQRERSLSDVWGSLMQGHWLLRALRDVGMMVGWGARQLREQQEEGRKKKQSLRETVGHPASGPFLSPGQGAPLSSGFCGVVFLLYSGN